MYIKHLELENFTVLHELNMDFSRGINVFIGEMVWARHIL